MTSFDWPSREEWARNRRTVYADMDNPHPATRRLSAYATADEIAASMAAIKAMLLAANRAERATEDSLGTLGRQRGESRRAYERRFSQMSREERDAVINSPSPCPYPFEVRDVLKQLRDDRVPWRWVGMGHPTPPHPLNAIMDRYNTAAKQADDVWHRQIEATPIDDDAWEGELQHRRRCDDDAAHPERFIHVIGGRK